MKTPPAIVLAAGEGIRLRPLTKYRPKPMLPIVTTPILEHVLDALIDASVTEITIVVGHGRERIQSYFGSTYRDVSLTYRFQDTQLGTGHALLEAAPPDEPYLLVNGDQIIDSQLIWDVINRANGAAMTLGVLPGRDVSDYGGAIVRNGNVVDLVDRPTDDRDYYLNAGVYCCSPKLHEAVASLDPESGERSLVDAIVALIEQDETVRGAVSESFWADANYPWDLLTITKDLLRDESQTHGGIDEDATVDPMAVIREPVAIGPNCEVAPGAVIGPYTALGENVTVGPSAVLEGSVIDRDGRIGPNATLIDTVTGIGVHVDAGVTVPGGPGDVRVGDRVFPEQRLGGLIADRVQVGGGSTLLPGSVIGPDARIGPGAVISGVIDAETHVRR